MAEMARTELLQDEPSVRLRARILAKIYESHFEPSDVVAVFSDMLELDMQYIGELWHLARDLPLNALPEILNLVSSIDGLEDVSRENWRSRRAIVSCCDDMLFRLLDEGLQIQPESLWRWLSTLYELNGRWGRTAVRVREWLNQNPEIVLSLFFEAVGQVDSLHSPWLFWRHFCSAMLYMVDKDRIAIALAGRISQKDQLDEKDQALYELALGITVNAPTPNTELFERLFELGELYSDLSSTRDALCFQVLEDGWQEAGIRIRERDASRTNTRARFAKSIESVKSGSHQRWLAWAAKVYFARFSDVDEKTQPRERLEAELGEEFADYASEGFRALTRRNNLPSPNDIAELYFRGYEKELWLALLAGIDEVWNEEGFIGHLSEKALRAGFTIDLLYPTYLKLGNTVKQSERGWKKAVFLERPALVLAVLSVVVRLGLEGHQEYIPGLSEICSHPELREIRHKELLSILREFSGMHAQTLKRLLVTVIPEERSSDELVELAETTLSAKSMVRGERRALWMAVAFLLNSEHFQNKAPRYFRARRDSVWALRDIVEHLSGEQSSSDFPLSAKQIGRIVEVVGKHFSNADRPLDVVLRGDRNPWDASEFVRVLIKRLSSRDDPESSEVLRGLMDCRFLESYRDQILHAIAVQSSVRRASEFVQPDWTSTVRALGQGAPANIADLHAMALDHLSSIQHEIRFGNTDKYKNFWSEDPDRRVKRVTIPKSEDSCRDRLIDELEPRFRPVGVRVEPEGHMAADKRADIVLLPPPGLKLPLELKQDAHDDLWSACETQLDRLYTRDPEAAGYGIYVVFWFGKQRKGRVPRPPRDIKAPETPGELEVALRSLVSPDQRERLSVFVVDVSPPT